MAEDQVYICELCQEMIDPTDPQVVRAVEIQEVKTFGETEQLEGLGVLFHPRCFPHGHPGYRIRSKT